MTDREFLEMAHIDPESPEEWVREPTPPNRPEFHGPHQITEAEAEHIVTDSIRDDHRWLDQQCEVLEHSLRTAGAQNVDLRHELADYRMIVRYAVVIAAAWTLSVLAAVWRYS